MKTTLLTLALFIATPAFAAKSCDELKGEIDAKIKAKGVKTYSLEIVANGEAKGAKVVGSCDSGKKQIIYKK